MLTIFIIFFTSTIEKLHLNEDFVRRTTGVCWDIYRGKKACEENFYFESCDLIRFVIDHDWRNCSRAMFNIRICILMIKYLG